jgi:methyltransferase (TIGR00027 family)
MSQQVFKHYRPSSTATLIAAAMAFLAGRPETAPLVYAENARLAGWLLHSHSRKLRLLAAALEQPWSPPLVRWVESRSIPGILEHFAQRKRVLDGIAREHLGAGDIGQLVVLGAGFDTLASRLTVALPEIRAVEVDHPHTQAWKKRALESCGIGAPRDFFPADLGRAASLAWLPREGRPMLWIAEGLTMYLQEPQVRELFSQVRAYSAAGSRIAFTFLEPGPRGGADFARRSSPVGLWLRSVREPFHWGIRREDLGAFLADLGLRLIPLPPELTRETDRLAVGEHIALAEVC